jgi:hypothetical protein
MTEENKWKVQEHSFNEEKLLIKFKELEFNSLMEKKYFDKFRAAWQAVKS